MLAGSPVLSVPCCTRARCLPSPKQLWLLLRHSLAKSRLWRDAFEHVVARERLPLDLC
jgi:hypothetical protein